MAVLKKKALENINGFGNCYAYLYKFQRAAIRHKFLFYLLYQYEGKSDCSDVDVGRNSFFGIERIFFSFSHMLMLIKLFYLLIQNSKLYSIRFQTLAYCRSAQTHSNWKHRGDQSSTGQMQWFSRFWWSSLFIPTQSPGNSSVERRIIAVSQFGNYEYQSMWHWNLPTHDI